MARGSKTAGSPDSPWSVACKKAMGSPHQPLGEPAGLRQKHPVVVALGQPGIHRLPDVQSRQNIEKRERANRRRMIERHAMGGPSAAIMGNEVKALVTQSRHEGNLIPCHGTKCKIGHLGLALAIATKIRHHHAVSRGEALSHAVPHGVGLWKSVQQQKWRPGATGARVDHRIADVDVTGFKSWKQIHGDCPQMRVEDVPISQALNENEVCLGDFFAHQSGLAVGL